jgi:hypothetical protein
MQESDILSLRSTTDVLIDRYLNPSWVAKLPFPSCFICTIGEPYNSSQSETIDLFSYCRGGVNVNNSLKGWIIRFDTAKYPVFPNKDYWGKHSSGHKLITDILKICHDIGQCKFVSNGSAGYGNNARKICCHRYTHYNDENRKKVNNAPLVKIGLTNKSCGMGKDNKNIARRTTSSKPNTKEHVCKACCILKIDNNSYYMTIGNGESLHTYHAPLDVSFVTKRKRIVPDIVIEDMAKQGFFKIKVGSAVHMSQQQHECNLSRRQIQSYMNFGHLATSLQELKLFEKDGEKISDPDRMLDYFERSKTPHMMLYHNIEETHNEMPRESLQIRNKKQKGELNTTKVSEIENGVPVVVMETFGLDVTSFDEEGTEVNKETHFQHTEMAEDISNMLLDGNNHRAANDIPVTQSLMLSFIWCLPHCRRIFQAFPEVVFIDGTHATNNCRLPLITVGVRDEQMNVLVVIRAFVPNEKAWMFRWLFQQAIPTLIGWKTCKRINLILTDGDSQEYSQLDAALMAGVYGKAMRRRCGWHINEKGSALHLSGFANNQIMQIAIKITKKWVQESLMKGVETAAEYLAYVFDHIAVNFGF